MNPGTIVNSIRCSSLFDVVPPLVSDYTPSRNITSRPIICLSILAAFRKIDRSPRRPRLCVNLIYAKSLDIIKSTAFPFLLSFSFPFSFNFLFSFFFENFQRIRVEAIMDVGARVPVIIRQPGCRISEQLCIDIHRRGISN